MTTAVSVVPDEPTPVIPLPAPSSVLQAQRVYLIVLGAIVITCIAAIVALVFAEGETKLEAVSIIGSLGSVCIGALAALARG